MWREGAYAAYTTVFTSSAVLRFFQKCVNDVGSIMMCERRGIDHDVVFWVIFLMWRFIHE
jgi:hypothetical protein